MKAQLPSCLQRQERELWPELRQTGSLGLLGKHPMPALSPEARHVGTHRHQSVTQPLRAALTAISEFTSESMLELVPVAKGERSEAQGGHCVTVCSLISPFGVLEDGEPQSQVQAIRSGSCPLWGWGS